MKYVIIPMFALLFLAGAIYAQDDEDSQGGSGLSQKQVGNFSVITAEDADVTTDGKQVYIEDIYEYVGRKFKAVEARLKKIEAGQEDLRLRVKKIEDGLAKLKNAAAPSP